ncbi:MAG: DUF2780 domain-containing protein [Gemmatimonadales bacterium]
MNLLESVMSRLEIDEPQAVRGLGALFLAIRMAVDMRTFTQIASAFPGSSQWMLEAPFQSGGTGEMLTMATPGAVRRILRIAGFTDDQIQALYEVAGSAIETAVPPEAFQAMQDNLPLFR